MNLWDSYKLDFSINHLGMYGETSAKNCISKKIKMGVYTTEIGNTALFRKTPASRPWNKEKFHERHRLHP